ncbi:MAG: hypothetical protein SGJ13_09840, partial [Actinomycetota bacterium]|nr:hypothetical protein [Actinomycetota bacterium]
MRTATTAPPNPANTATSTKTAAAEPLSSGSTRGGPPAIASLPDSLSGPSAANAVAPGDRSLAPVVGGAAVSPGAVPLAGGAVPVTPTPEVGAGVADPPPDGAPGAAGVPPAGVVALGPLGAPGDAGTTVGIGSGAAVAGGGGGKKVENGVNGG